MKESKFTGGVLGCLGHAILFSLIVSFTLGIATPWAVCMYASFIADNTTIDGHRVKFEGSGASLFGNWIVWVLLTIITFGIYGFWVTPKMIDWVVKNIHVVED